MNSTEKKSVLSLAFLYSTRMLGLFMVLPVFMIYGQDLGGANELLLGIAIGAYGLSQALFQVPFGALSDRFGRKPLIMFGLMLFFIGSVVAAMSEHIYGVIIGRFLQGAGAIASVLMALLSDLTSEQSRTKAMATVGMSIGVSFSLAIVLGPLLAEYAALKGIFWLTAAMALVGMAWLFWMVPTPLNTMASRDTRLMGDQLKAVLRNTELVRLDAGIFILHMALTAMFIAVPVSLIEQANVAGGDHWLVYLTVMVLSFFAMVPFIIIGEKKRKMKQVFVFAISLLVVSSFSVIWAQGAFLMFWFSLFFFFMAFNLLEASLPSLVSKTCPAGSKGTAMGVYSTSQFMGAFVGGLLGGVLISRFGINAVYLFVALACIAWLFIALGMINPNPKTDLTLNFSSDYDELAARRLSDLLSKVRGVEEVVAIPGERAAYLKVVSAELDHEGLEKARAAFEA